MLYARQSQDVEQGRAVARTADLKISDFARVAVIRFCGSALCAEALKEGIGSAFTGTSNVLLAMDTDLEALGTNAHELPMVLAALANTDEELRSAPYRVLQDWNRYYGGNLLIVLPGCFWHGCFSCAMRRTGLRIGQASAQDSAPPIEGGERIIEWWKSRGKDPREKLIFSDALDVDTIMKPYRHFEGRVRMSFGWGTNSPMIFAGCAPTTIHGLKAISLVCKVIDANGRPAVKLSDNHRKQPAIRRKSSAI